jgi:hypothetical protein
MTAAYAKATTSGVMTTIPTVLHGVVFTDTVAGATCEITDGNGGASVMTIAINAARVTISVQFPEPLHLQNGVAVNLSGANSHVTIIYT